MLANQKALFKIAKEICLDIAVLWVFTGFLIQRILDLLTMDNPQVVV